MIFGDGRQNLPFVILIDF